MVTRILTLALALAASTPALAQDGREEFERGSRYFDAEEYGAALEQFERAYTLSGGRPSVIFMVAQCERALARYDAAIEHFEIYLKSGLEPDEATEIRETLGLLREQTRRQADAEATRRAEAEAREKERAEAEASRLARAKAEADAAQAAAEAARAKAEAKVLEAELKAKEVELETKELQLEAKAAPPPALVASPPPPAEEEGSILSSPVFWIVTGVAVVGGGVAAAFVARDHLKEPYGGTADIALRP